MADAVVGALADPHADALVEDPPALLDAAVLDRVGPRLLAGILADGRLAEADAARPQVGQLAAADGVVRAAALQVQAVAGGVADLAALEGAVAHAVAQDGRRHVDGGLSIDGVFGI